nr:hypothetical protein [Physocyclus mexicanus]
MNLHALFLLFGVIAPWNVCGAQESNVPDEVKNGLSSACEQKNSGLAGSIWNCVRRLPSELQNAFTECSSRNLGSSSDIQGAVNEVCNNPNGASTLFQAGNCVQSKLTGDRRYRRLVRQNLRTLLNTKTCLQNAFQSRGIRL